MGFPLRVSSSSIIKLCEVYGESLETFEKILIIEDIAYEHILAKAKEKAKQDKGAEKINPKRIKQHGFRNTDKHVKGCK